jgi:hypothetical protein
VEKGQEDPPQDQALAHRVRWADLDSVFAHMGDNTSVGEASNGIHLINDREHVAVRQDHEVRIPDEYLMESYVGQRDSDLRKAREMLLQAKQERPSYKPDILLGLATTFVGWFLGGLSSSVNLASLLGILMLCVAPCGAVGLFVAFIFIRKEENQGKSDLAERVLEHLADPDGKETKTDEH